MNFLQSGISCLFIGVISFSVFAEGNNTPQVNGVGLGVTRVIYPSSSKGVTLRVDNSTDFPFLVKSTVLDENRHEGAAFIVTPPLFRLDGGQRNTLQITRTGGDFPGDRESMNWLCVQSISPEADSVWAGGKKEGAGPDKISASMRLLPSSCIKLLVRPGVIKGNPVDVADKVSWSISGKTVMASNPTPFYMNIGHVDFNGKKITMERSYIPPFSEEKFISPVNEIRGTVKWTVIGDYGEEREKIATVK
ncbi:fimbria/pilus periplasmic chaperone [Salmonella enterica]|uniref:Fimbria/pilus periplasmic chaperone n=1 Tax=Salmonella enterica TaxID=28901 RepID=A0A5V4Z4M8_SALER|nr:fimbria/pilus periplasmic chaperone [Salmonella enterica]EIU1711117.1 fimbria/pilus periplasmic chaperone [Salmonella enterica]